jgi:choline dehydrogenase
LRSILAQSGLDVHVSSFAFAFARGNHRQVFELERITDFRIDLPVDVSFGDGVVAELAGRLADLGASSVGVIVEAPVADLPPVASALEACANRGVIVERLVKEPGEPTFSAVGDAAGWLEETEADAVVAIGGGSAIDLAKGARLVWEHGGPVERYLESPIPSARAPLLAIPTTAGTGSEVSLDAVLTDESTHTKRGLNSSSLRAQQALVDPLLTLRLPARATAFAGIDALAQAIGGVITTKRNPISLALGLESCRLIGRSLVRAVRDGSDRAARRDLAAASLLAGLAMSISECAAEHSLGQAIGGLYALPHGLTIGLVLAETLEINRPNCGPELERIADALDAPPGDGLPLGGRAIAEVRRLLATLEFPTLASVGVSAERVDELVARSLADDFVRWSPHAWSEDDFRAAYREALALTDR